MFIESLDSLPEELKPDFVASEFEGKKGFQHKSTVSLANALKNAKEEKDQYRTKLSEIETRLNGYEETKKAEIEQAKTEALEKARSSGDVKTIEERYKQQLADLEKRTNEQLNERDEKIKSITTRVKQERQSAIVSDLSDFATDDGKPAFKALLKSRTEIDDEGNTIYLDENGGATTLDKKGFIAQLQKEPMFKPLMRSDVVTKSNGNLNGGKSGGANTPTATRAEFEGWPQDKRSDFFKSGGKLN